MKTDVIIVNYNVKELLRKCLASLLAENIADLNIIVVDNASSDGSVEMIRQEFPSVKLIASERNIGFSAGNNLGLKNSSGDLILLLNPDTEVVKGSLSDFLAAGLQKQLVLIGPKLLNSDGTVQESAWKRPSVRSMIAEALFLHKLFRVSQYDAKQFDSAFSPGMISGAAMLFPRNLYEKIGGLDEHLFWMEDADFSVRAKDAGAELNYYPHPVFVHHSGKSSTNYKLVISNQLLSKLKFYRKHRNYAVFLTGCFFCLIHIVTRIVLFLPLSLLSTTSRKKLGAYVFSFGKYFRYLFTNDRSVT